MKLTNRIIIGLVISLLLAVLILLLIILCGSDTKMITDWISSLSTAGTLLVAYMAYRKAPEWFESKHNEARYEYIREIINMIDKYTNKLESIGYAILFGSYNTSSPELYKKYENAKFDILGDIIRTQDMILKSSRYNLQPNEFLERHVKQALEYVSVMPELLSNEISTTDKDERFVKLKNIIDNWESMSKLPPHTLFEYLKK
ncbi:hypothetical protein [Serratia ureilytica]|uniref:hypothetical protein n=1 Tax=Serratia ureilytica TaxID=300181 RepID=UPI001D180F4E|nr:hypothetical protein [Serratia ureilytica]MCC4104695.1 hypothetical protein [Serratia ureilytica]